MEIIARVMVILGFHPLVGRWKIMKCGEDKHLIPSPCGGRVRERGEQA
jgi:hypothetical protein